MKKFGKWTKVYVKKVLRPLLKIEASMGEKPLSNDSVMGITHKQGIDHPKVSKQLIEEFLEKIRKCHYFATEYHDEKHLLKYLKELKDEYKGRK